MMTKLKKTQEILLHLLDELPGAEASSLRAELLLLYGTLSGHLAEAERMSQDYDAVAGRIRAKASVHKRLKAIAT